MSQEKKQGGAMGGVDDLYREVILEHFKTPRNKGNIASPSHKAEGLNPLCGDQITVELLAEGDKIKDVKFSGHGCAISQSAASIMTQLVKGQTVEKIKGLAAAYKETFGVKDDKLKNPGFTIEDLGDALALEGVKKYPVRIKCALLSWNTLLEAMAEKKGK